MKLRARLALVLLGGAIPLTAGIAWVRADVERRAAEGALRDFIFARMEGGGREECEAWPATFQEPPLFGPRGPRPPGAPPGAPPGPPPLAGPPPGGRRPGMRLPPEGPPPYDPERRPGPGMPPGPEPRGPDLRGPGAGAGGGGPGPNRPPFPGGPPPRRIELFAYAPDFVSANPNAPAFPAELREALARGRASASRVVPADAGTAWLELAARMPWTEGPAAIVLARRLDPAGPRPAATAVLWGAAALSAGLLAIVLLAAGPTVGRIRRLTAHVRRAASDRYATPVEVGGSDEIAELGRAFNDAGAELRAQIAALEERERTLREFVANTTHDIATPLTVLQGHLAALRRASDAGALPERARVLDALEEAHYLASLLHNLGAAAKLDAGARDLQRHRVDLNRLVERAVGRHRPIAAQRGVAVDFAVPERTLAAEGDETLLEQSLSNVIQNAVRYNDRGGHVAVTLEERKNGDGPGFAVRVLDDGPGVPAQDLARLGERSFRSEAARTRHPGGLGIGLSIARDVAARHGFSLAIRAAQPTGLEVEIAGPLAGDVGPAA